MSVTNETFVGLQEWGIEVRKHGQHTVVSRVYANVMNMRKKQCSSFGIMHSGRPS